MEFDLDSSSSQVTPKQLAALRSWIDTFPFMNEEQGFTLDQSETSRVETLLEDWAARKALIRKRKKVSDQSEGILQTGSELPRL